MILSRIFIDIVNSRNLKAILFAGFLFTSTESFAALEDFFVDTDITVATDNNVNQAKLDTDSVNDMITTANVILGYQYNINSLNAVSFGTGIRIKEYQEVASQNSMSGLFNIAYIFQRSYGYRAPIYQLSVSSELQDNDVRQQDSTIINAQFIASMRITDIISATAGLGFQDRDSDSTVYDLSDQRFFISGDYALNKQATFYGTINFITGETFSVIRPDTDEERYIALSVGPENIQWDDAYNQEFPSQVTRWQAYKIEADTIAYLLGFNYGFGHGNSVDLSYTYADVSGEAGADYQRDIFSATLLKRF